MGKNQAIEQRWVYGVCKDKPQRDFLLRPTCWVTTSSFFEWWALTDFECRTTGTGLPTTVMLCFFMCVFLLGVSFFAWYFIKSLTPSRFSSVWYSLMKSFVEEGFRFIPCLFTYNNDNDNNEYNNARIYSYRGTSLHGRITILCSLQIDSGPSLIRATK